MEYSKFYDSIIEFLNKTDRTGHVKCKGISVSEIETIEDQLGSNLPGLLRSYLLLFGQIFEFFSMKKHEYIFSYDEIKDAIKIYDKYNLKSLTKELLPLNQTSLIPLLYDEMRAQMIILDTNSSIGNMYLIRELYFSEVDVCDSDEIEIVPYMDFFQNIQERVFLEIKGAIRAGGISSKIDLSQLEWCKFHIYYHVHPHPKYNISFSRKDYLKKQGNMAHPNRVFNFCGYEKEFIRFLIYDKGVPAIPEIYDETSQF